ncbi:MAG: hypothetical protein K6F56_06370 [Oscillospiraceae bacterium]|nr:hypothetical protein [Oscillospiraceae bacterium]
MDYSAANASLWNIIIQLGLIAGAILVANMLRTKVRAIRQAMMPVAVMAGFLLLILKYIGVVSVDGEIMEILVYHGIALGFIAMSLRVPDKLANKKDKAALKSGMIIVSTYMVQAITGLVITMLLGFTLMPTLFKASGILLPMGYGQGPGQANNVGTSYQNLGFAGGRSFGLAVAAAGYLCACIVGVILLNVLAKRGSVSGNKKENDDHLEVGFFQDKNELPVSDSIDRLSVQLAMVLVTYAVTFFATWGLTSGISAISEGLGKTLNTLLWGFNFIIGSAIAVLLRSMLEMGRRKGIIMRQYQNNYLLNRISGFFFDIMIVAGISSINIEDLSGLWLPFVLISVAGGLFTWLHLKRVCRWAYPGYYYEGLISMYGMMTGTISSGVLLLREIDSDLSTPAANNLVSGSSVGIILGAPVLVLVSVAAKSDLMTGLVILIAAAYLTVLLLALHRVSFGKKEKN